MIRFKMQDNNYNIKIGGGDDEKTGAESGSYVRTGYRLKEQDNNIF